MEREPASLGASRLQSVSLFDRARQVIPGGTSRSTAFFQPHPLYIRDGAGSRLRDVDGNEFFDFTFNHTSLIHGHAHPAVIERASSVMAGGTAFSAPTEYEVEYAEYLRQRVRSFEMVAFVNSGSEAVMRALQAARAHSGKIGVAKVEGAYHGSYDPVTFSLSPAESVWGTSAAPTAVSTYGPQLEWPVVVLPFNDLESTSQLLHRHRDTLGAVLLDLMPVRLGLAQATSAYAHGVQDVCRELGILLVVDEIITFRADQGGLQERYGLDPDLTTLGKIVGGGFPIGVVGGRAEVMTVLDPSGRVPRAPYAGTFNANPVSLAAGMEAMQRFDRASISKLNDLGGHLLERASALFTELRCEWQIKGDASLFEFHPSTREITDYRSYKLTADEAARLRRLHRILLENGVFVTTSGLGCLSTASDIEDVEHLLRALHVAVTEERERPT
jgi:glutamate-1-semialdehyde 2,1-aminomutase